MMLTTLLLALSLPLDPAARLHGVTLHFSRTQAQEAELRELIAAQHDPSSPRYHQWLTPAQFDERFGPPAATVAAAKSWLQQQGLPLEGEAPDHLRFAASAGELAQVSLPEGAWIGNLSTVRPRPHLKMQPAFTSSQSGSHFVTPKDLAVIYDIAPAYAEGLDGAGQTIAVVGQSSISLTDIENFQKAAGVTVHDPQIVLVPNSGTSTAVKGDQAESDLDLEYTSSVAPGASIVFVYTGNSTNYSAFDSIQYAVQQNLAQIISVSYGTCELSLDSGSYRQLEAILQQAASQGQSVIVASGDEGSTDCYGQSGVSSTNQKALAVDFPSSSEYATGLGGSEFLAADVATTNSTYWTAAVGSDVIGSAKSYIPEQVWNDDGGGALSSGGGGVSVLTARPSWQTGVAGIPSGTMRVVPDVSLAASPNNAGYLYCSSDSSTGVTGSCAHGFRDGNTTNLTVGGGTSFAAPVFAGMLALLNQKLSSKGQGVVAATLYSLAANSSTYASAFHDITVGGNACGAGSSICSPAGSGAYSATAGYDPASGLGSIDFYSLLNAWPGASSNSASTTTTVAAATSAPAAGEADAISIAVASATGTPTGSVTISVDGATTASATLANGAATYSFSSATAGAHTVSVVYTGDSTHLASRGSVAITVGEAGFDVAASNVTLAVGGTGTSTVTITPRNGYTGTVTWAVSSSPALSAACFTIPGTAVTGASGVNTQLTIDAGSTCSASALRTRGALPIAFALVGFVGLARKRKKWAALLLTLCACGGNQVASTANDVKGTFAVTLAGTDSTAGVTSSTTFTLTIQ